LLRRIVEVLWAHAVGLLGWVDGAVAVCTMELGIGPGNGIPQMLACAVCGV